MLHIDRILAGLFMNDGTYNVLQHEHQVLQNFSTGAETSKL